MRRAVLAVLVAVLSLGAVPVATASTTVSVEGGVLNVVAAPGETNKIDVSLNFSGTNDYTVRDNSAGATAGPGCVATPHRPFEPQQPSVDCPAAGVQSIVIRLGDGDDGTGSLSDLRDPGVLLAVFGEGGNDEVTIPDRPGTVSDGGEGDDNLYGGDDVRGGPGNDAIAGSRLLDSGDGNDILRKTGAASGAVAGGQLAGGPGDDQLEAQDGKADQLLCGPGRDVIALADESDSDDGSCESGEGVTPPVEPQVTVFELVKGSTRPGRDGKLAVWMKCSVPDCAVTVRILFLTVDSGRGRRAPKTTRFRKPAVGRVVVGTTAKVFRVPLSKVQRRVLSRNKASKVDSSIGAITILRGAGGTKFEAGILAYCSRADPCFLTGGGPR